MTTRVSPPSPGGLRTLSSARWPERPGDAVDPLPGFIVSSFNPLVAQVAERCLDRYYGPAPAGDPGRARRTALLLASSGWDLGTAAELTAAVESGRRVQPLLFFQSNPNAVLGHVAARWGLGGPMVCSGPPPTDVVPGPWAEPVRLLGPAMDGTDESDHDLTPDRTGPAPGAADRLLADALWQAALVIEDGDADEALVIAVEQGTAGRTDSAVAVLVAPESGRGDAGTSMRAEGRTR